MIIIYYRQTDENVKRSFQARRSVQRELAITKSIIQTRFMNDTIDTAKYLNPWGLKLFHTTNKARGSNTRYEALSYNNDRLITC